MLNAIKSLLQGSESSRRVTEKLPDAAVAVCALLLEAAEVDNEFTDEERGLIGEQLRHRFGLNVEEVGVLIAETQRQRAASADLWPFTHAIRSQYTPEEKRELLVLVWQILLTDARLTAHEEQWARRLHEMLAVNHSLLFDAKRQARQLLADVATAPA